MQGSLGNVSTGREPSLFFSRSLVGIGGRIKCEPEDFRVDEIALYAPSGEGPQLLLRIEKRGMTTHEAVQHLSRAFHIPERDVGFAGIKDSRAVTTQWMSVPAACESRLAALDHPWLKIREQVRHAHKLRVGELDGNRFEIVVRELVGPVEVALENARAIVALLAKRGVPNWFGEQRFGTKGDSDLLGKALVRSDCAEALALFLGRPAPQEHDPRIRAARRHFDEGDLAAALASYPPRLRTEATVLNAYREHKDPFRALMKIPKRLRLLFLSAYQSRLFNRCLAARFDSLDRILEGDVVVRHATDRAYPAGDLAQDQARADRFEISPAGPLFGPGLLRPRGEAARAEEAVFAAEGLDLEERRQVFPDLHLRGERRAYRFPLRDATVDPIEDGRGRGLVVRFTLPRSCYATVVLAELMKDAAAAQAIEAEKESESEGEGDAEIRSTPA